MILDIVMLDVYLISIIFLILFHSGSDGDKSEAATEFAKDVLKALDGGAESLGKEYKKLCDRFCEFEKSAPSDYKSELVRTAMDAARRKEDFYTTKRKAEADAEKYQKSADKSLVKLRHQHN